MNNIELAIKYFNENNFDNAETLALEVFNKDNSSVEALDVLAAIFLKNNKLNVLNDKSLKNLILLRKLAAFLSDLKTYAYAIEIYKKILEITPNDEIALNNIGLLLENLDKIEEAKSYYEKALKVKDNYHALYNLGVLSRKLKDFKSSEQCLHKALNIKPDNEYANYSLGMTYLMQKKFTDGYKYFRKRPVRERALLKNFWNGEKHQDKTVLVYCEYGFGDAIMFSRYFPLLKKYFQSVKVCCKPQLLELLKNSFDNIEFVTTINTEYDFSVFSMDLPCYLKLDFDNIPLNKGYLKVDDEKYELYKQKYFNNDLYKVGLFFVGGELQKRNARYRAVELNKLEKLFGIKNIKFYSFQKEDIFNELKDYPEIVDLGKDFKDFSDTAAAMKNLDLMISIDSVPIHLAGALNIKGILMLPYFSEWRWFCDENKTPWYESIEIIKQTTFCDWQNVVDEIYKKLNV